jgi:predicted permease
LLIGVGTGVCTLIFDACDAILERALPVRDPDTLVELFELRPNLPPRTVFPEYVYDEIAADSTTLYALVAQSDSTASFQFGNQVERISLQGVTGNYFTALGVPGLHGAFPAAGERGWAVLSFDYWRRAFRGEPSVVGSNVRVDGRTFRVIGVTARGFNGTSADRGADIRVDLRDLNSTPSSTADPQFVEIVGRLRSGSSLSQAQQEIAALARRTTERMIAGESAASLRRSLAESRFELQAIGRGVSWLRTQLRVALIALLGGAGLLLLIVSSNVSSLLLMKVVASDREMAVRLAIGAQRARIIRGQVIEALVPTFFGSALGLALAVVFAPILASSMPAVRSAYGVIRPVSIDLHLDARGMLFCLSLCALAVIAASVAPAWRAAGNKPATALRRPAGGRHYGRSQLALSALQVALSAALIIAAGWLLRSVANLRRLDTGLDLAHVITFSMDTGLNHYGTEQTRSFQSRLLAEVRALPGVEAAGYSASPVLQGIGMVITVVTPGGHAARWTGPNSSVNFVGNGYFASMGMRVLNGRTSCEASDLSGPVTPVVVNEAFAKSFLRGGSPIGRQFATGSEFVVPMFDIVGEVGDAKYRSLAEPVPPTFYIPRFESNRPPTAFVLNVRVRGDAHSVVNPVRRMLHLIDPSLPAYHTATLEEDLEVSLGPERFVLKLASGMAVIAVLLSAVGLYGVLAQFVAGARRDIGIHIALGARSIDIVWLVFRQILSAVAIGGSAGAVGSLLIGASIRSLLYETRLLDSAVFVAAALILGLTTVCGSAIPALRALRVQPATSMRED